MMIIIILLAVWWYNNFTLCVSETEIRSKKINEEITVVHLSDLHGAVFGKGNSRLISKVEEQDPDVIFITGDMYTHGENGGVGTALDLMRELAKEFDVFYVNGEHDYAYKNTSFFDDLRAGGVNVMDYKDEVITVKNTQLHIYGITNAQYSGTFILSLARSHAYLLNSKCFGQLIRSTYSGNCCCSCRCDQFSCDICYLYRYMIIRYNMKHRRNRNRKYSMLTSDRSLPFGKMCDYAFFNTQIV